MKKVLVTGANGFLGASLIKQFDSRHYDLTALVRTEKHMSNNEVVIDLCDDNLGSKLNALGIHDVIVHAGARIGWDGSSKSDLYIPNVLATAELLKFAKRCGAYFIFISAAIVCGVKKNIIKQNDSADPDTDYAYSKWLGEELVKCSGVKSCILRPAGIFGLNGPAHLGINTAISNAIKGISPVLNGPGAIRRNYVFVKDASRIIKYCIDNELEGTYNLSGTNESTLLGMLEIIRDVFLPGKTIEVKPGKIGSDQIIERSKQLPAGCSFEEAIKEIKEDFNG